MKRHLASQRDTSESIPDIEEASTGHCFPIGNHVSGSQGNSFTNFSVEVNGNISINSSQHETTVNILDRLYKLEQNYPWGTRLRWRASTPIKQDGDAVPYSLVDDYARAAFYGALDMYCKIKNKDTYYLLNMQYYESLTGSKSGHMVFQVIAMMTERIRVGSFNPYGNGQTSQNSRERRRERRKEVKESSLPQIMKEMINEEIDLQSAKEERNKQSDIKQGRLLNYFRRDFVQAALNEKVKYDFAFTCQKFVSSWYDNGYDVNPETVKVEVLTHAVRIFLQTGLVVSYQALKRRVEEGYVPEFRNRKQGLKIRRTLLKYSFLLDMPQSFSDNQIMRSQGFFSYLVESVVDEVKSSVLKSVGNTWDSVKGFLVDQYRKFISIWSEYSRVIMI